jgi:hypothetical protein
MRRLRRRYGRAVSGKLHIAAAGQRHKRPGLVISLCGRMPDRCVDASMAQVATCDQCRRAHAEGRTEPRIRDIGRKG